MLGRRAWLDRHRRCATLPGTGKGCLCVPVAAQGLHTSHIRMRAHTLLAWAAKAKWAHTQQEYGNSRDNSVGAHTPKLMLMAHPHRLQQGVLPPSNSRSSSTAHMPLCWEGPHKNGAPGPSGYTPRA